MVGFPGETQELFEESRSFIEHLPFTYLHVFTYSSRPGTPSASMPGQVPVAVARERNKVLRDVAAEKNLAFRQRFLGRTLDAITLQTGDDLFTEALTDNYLKVRIAGRHEANQWMKVEISGIGASVKSLQKSIDNFESRMVSMQQNLLAQYSKIDAMLQQMPLIISQINSQLGSL